MNDLWVTLPGAGSLDAIDDRTLFRPSAVRSALPEPHIGAGVRGIIGMATTLIVLLGAFLLSA